MLLRPTVLAFSFFLCCPLVKALGYGDQTTYSVDGKVTKVRRERNLDHWDSDTLAYYLDDYRGHDVAIMFYAQWDRNSHSLAPYWDRIATTLDAGNSKSRLIMSLFDCELNQAHSTLCTELNINAYPTLLFVGSGPYHDTDPISKSIFGSKSAGFMGEAPVINTVKFQGFWQYGDAIVDWIRTMQALSNWHLWSTEGFGRRLRNFLIPHKTSNKPLPVGIPGSGAVSGTADSSSFAAKTMEDEIQTLKLANEKLGKTVLREHAWVANLLAPSSTQDMYSYLDKGKIWKNKEKNSTKEKVIRQCVIETSLDYCQKVAAKVGTDMVDELEAAGKSLEDMAAMENLEQDLLDRVAAAEPYCKLVDQCVISDYEDEVCRPKTCPFQNEIACVHLTSCLKPELQTEYADAMGITEALV